MTKRLHIRFPQGSGGNWLGEILHDLNYKIEETTDIPVNFHNEKFANTDYSTGHDYKDQSDIVFSSHCAFNFFCNHWWKSRVFQNGDNFNNLSDSEKIFLLSEEARWRLFSTDYKKNYLENISLDWSWIWNDPTQFYQKISQLLNRKLQNVDRVLFDKSVDLYKITNVRTLYHYDNPYSILWISWCFAICTEQKNNLEFEFKSCNQIPQLVNYLKKYRKTFLDITEPRILHT